MFDVVFLALTMLAGSSQHNLKMYAEISSIHLEKGLLTFVPFLLELVDVLSET